MKKNNNNGAAAAASSEANSVAIEIGMPKRIYTDLSDDERKEKMKSEADKVLRYTYLREYTEEELNERKTALAEVSIKISDLEAELAALKSKYKYLINPEADKREEVVADLRRGGVDVTEDCYGFISIPLRKVGIYNGAGELVREEEINPETDFPNLFRNLEDPDFQPQPENGIPLLGDGSAEAAEGNDAGVAPENPEE